MPNRQVNQSCHNQSNLSEIANETGEFAIRVVVFWWTVKLGPSLSFVHCQLSLPSKQAATSAWEAMRDPDPLASYAENAENSDLPQGMLPGTAPPIVLTIAGFDPSGGAGIIADLKTFAAHRIYGVACISALTVQSTQGVQAVQELSPEIVRHTLDCLADDLQLDGVKIGMLGTAPIVVEVASFLQHLSESKFANSQTPNSKAAKFPRARVVLDPVLFSSSGAALLDSAGVDVLIDELLVSTGWITPNSAELAVLIGSGPVAQNEIPEAARRLQELAAEKGNRELNVVVTGGDFAKPDDFLLLAGGAERWLRGTHVRTTSTHGTGCAFSSALLCHLLAGEAPVDAATSAKTFVTEALRSAYPVGKGKGPPDHFFRLWAPSR